MLPFGVYIGQNIGEKKVLIICSFVLPISILASSFVTNFYIFSIFYGFIFGLVAGVAYMIPIKLSYKYYPHKKGLISGIISAGYGLGSFTFSWLVFFIVNPQNKSVENNGFMPNDVSEKWPLAL